jgi:uncharacterized membrane protein
MNFRKIDVSSGIHWLSGAVRLVLRNPVEFLVMGLIIAAINLVPVLGGLFLALCGPALSGGIVYAAREQDQGRKPEIVHLFRAFQEPGRITPMLMLCLPSLVGGFVILVFGFVFGLSALIGGGLSAAATDGSGAHWLAALGGGFLAFGLVAVAVLVAVYALQFFAIPRVMLDHAEPWEAMRDSLSACLANLGAFLLYAVVLLVVAGVLFVVLAIIPLLGWLALFTVLAAVTACAQYLAYREVYGGAAGSAEGMPEPPSPAK